MEFKCSQCKKSYTPIHSTEQMAKDSGNEISMEQHMTQICSRKCFLKSLGTYLQTSEDLNSTLDKYGEVIIVIESKTETNQGPEYEEMIEGKVEKKENGYKVNDTIYSFTEMDDLIQKNVAYYQL